MVFGYNSPRIKELKEFIQKKEAYEVFPDLVMNLTTIDKLVQQLHYIINRNKTGVFHLGSNDLVHHDDFFKEIVNTIALKDTIFKNVYTTNDERYLAVLPKKNMLPKHLQLVSQDVLSELVL